MKMRTRSCRPSQSISAADRARPPLTVELQGRTSVLVETPDGPRASVILSCRAKDSDEEIRRDKESLPAFLDHVVLAAAGLSQGRVGHRGLLLLTDGDKHEIEVRRFAALDPARARDYLARLVRDMLTGTLGPAGEPSGLHAYVLPCEAVFHARRKGVGQATRPPVSANRSAKAGAFVSAPGTGRFATLWSDGIHPPWKQPRVWRLIASASTLNWRTGAT